MPTSSDKNISTPIFNVLTRDIYNSLTTVDPDQFYLITDDTGITPGSGLTATTAGGETIIGHSNSISAITTQSVYPITIDTEGHISSVGSAIDLSDLGGSGNGGFILTRDASGNFTQTGSELIQAWSDGKSIYLYQHWSDGSTDLLPLIFHGPVDTYQVFIFQYETATSWRKLIVGASAQNIWLEDMNYGTYADYQHAHGIISYSGRAGTDPNKALYTVTNGDIAAGTLPVAAGGTGLTTVTSGSVLIGNGTSSLTTRAITNNTSATTATTNSNLITGSTLYYATANINNARQTSNVGIYAPTGGGTAGQILTASGTTSAPVWTNTGSITVGAAVKDGAGNTIATYYSPTTHTHGNITTSGAMTITASMVTSDNIIFADTSNNNLLTVTSAQAGMSVLINALSEGTSAANRNDYIVAQYVNGGTTTITYHRRKLSNIFAALNSSDITTALGYTPVNKAGDTMTGVLTLSSSTSAGFTGRNISYGTAAPSGGANGDVYIQYTN